MIGQGRGTATLASMVVAAVLLAAFAGDGSIPDPGTPTMVTERTKTTNTTSAAPPTVDSASAGPGQGHKHDVSEQEGNLPRTLWGR